MATPEIAVKQLSKFAPSGSNVASSVGLDSDLVKRHHGGQKGWEVCKRNEKDDRKNYSFRILEDIYTSRPSYAGTTSGSTAWSSNYFCYAAKSQILQMYLIIAQLSLDTVTLPQSQFNHVDLGIHAAAASVTNYLG